MFCGHKLLYLCSTYTTGMSTLPAKVEKAIPSEVGPWLELYWSVGSQYKEQ